MEKITRPAREITPGRILTRELEARGWTQKDLAGIMGRPTQAINKIVKGTKQITPETALELAEAFGTSAELWTNLEAQYRLVGQ
jgi:addiction module HigA family antidote